MNNYFIIGKVNEGKSHLFNLFSKEHKTISNPKENTTVDIIRKQIQHNNYNYFLYDTPGFYSLKEFNLLLKRIENLGLQNIQFIYLANNFLDEDLKICKLLFKKKYPCFYFSFKNNSKIDLVSNLFVNLFINTPDNLSNLKKYLINQCLNNEDTAINDLEKNTVAIFGKENTGKSTLFNKITDISLSLTSPNLHTTRDSVNWDVKYKGQIISFFDTAGFIRSRSNRKYGDFEKFSINQSEYFIKNSSLIVLLLDATSESRLDLSLIGSLAKRNKPFLVLVNKMDLVKEKIIYQKNLLIIFLQIITIIAH